MGYAKSEKLAFVSLRREQDALTTPFFAETLFGTPTPPQTRTGPLPGPNDGPAAT